ncbi:hypothetical protein HB4184_09305 [Pseudomonas putida]|nr:hypothetical protein HB4184_09305 [Pseudomonas putida]
MSLFDKLKKLQWKQLQHDEKYHKEICVLKVQERMTHMTLHLSKYSSKLVDSAAFEHKEKLFAALVDTLIIVFSSANIFGRPLSNFAIPEHLKNTRDITELSRLFLSDIEPNHLPPLLNIAIKINNATGLMCKTVESLDHLEEFSFRGNLLDCLATIFQLSLAMACHLGNDDIEEDIANRLYFVESKHMFFEELGNYKDGYRHVLER